MKSARRRSREFALQGLYQWLLAGGEAATIESEIGGMEGFSKADRPYFSDLLQGSVAAAPQLEVTLKPCLDRRLTELSPVERGILLLATYEFERHPEIPFRVVINEAIELAKVFGGTDGHKYVNGVLDKLALSMRGDEVAARAAGRAKA